MANIMLNNRDLVLRQPENLRIEFSPSTKVLSLKGPCGVFCYGLQQKLRYKGSEKKFWLVPEPRTLKSTFQLSQVLLIQSCLGVTLGYRRQLNLRGVGYQVSMEKDGVNKILVFKLGLSHKVVVFVPDFLSVSCPKHRIVLITGINLQKVNNFAALLRDLKLPNSYKEKGIYYKEEVLKLKQGKKT